MDKIVLDNKKLMLDRVISLANDGISYSNIGKLVGSSRQRVSQICLQNGIVRRPGEIKRENWERYWERKDNHSDECLFQVTAICTCGQCDTEKTT